jgi:proteasome lid subunit RPN8/RPN11
MERCWILTKGDGKQPEAHQMTVGGVASVEADWGWAMAREEERGDVVGFWHTHPAGAGTAPSRRDIRTMQAWCSALGKPLLCLISEEGREGEAAVYLFEDDESEGRPVNDSKIWAISAKS